MKSFKIVSALMIALMLACCLVPNAMAEQKQEKTITLTMDRRVMPQSLFHPSVFLQDGSKVTVTVSDYVIRDYSGDPIKGFTVQTASGQTLIPIDDVKEIEFSGCVSTKTEDIDYVEHVSGAEILLVNGKKKNVVINADFGTIEGKTKRGDFFLGKPNTVVKLVFNR
jgi:hypothetical protein